MTTPAVDLLVQQFLRVEGHIFYDGYPVPIEKSTPVMRVYDRRPRSVSNPVQPNGQRREASWSHEAAYIHAGSGVVSEQNGNGSWRRVLHGQVTAPMKSVGTDHTLARSLLNKARMSALSRMTESKSQFNVAAHELKGTIGTLSTFCQKAVQGVEDAKKALKRRDPRLLLPPRTWKSWPGDYLGYLYGLAPLADDIANGMDQLSGLSRQGMAFGYQTKSGSTDSDTFEEEVYNTFAVDRRVYARGCRRTAFARVGYNYWFPQWWLDTVPIITPFSDAWELTRLSFVADWALPLGSWIGAMEAAQFDPYFVGGFEVYGTEEFIRGPFTVREQSGITGAMLNDGYVNRRYSMERIGLAKEDRPSGRVVFPNFQKFLNLNRASQGLSLLAQAFNSPARRS